MTFAEVLTAVRDGRHHDGDRSALARAAVAALAVLLVLSFFFSLASGASEASAWRVFLELTGMKSGTLEFADRIVVFDIRMPRAVLGVLIGAALAVSGAVLQGLFRNPLAEPPSSG